ncbi:Beta-D-xylosidase 7 precursor [Actinidia chinensis var. chinensis]|uniref:Beta-D-xylosidase 7 n=1 Tax=Actinidia chinensis var. chinensis TaxID=1590841 RepID=A0A2R6QYC4_ACTCC|nr:Beta-D-xylosidase 7 precursor [Actinidia chinensis var. chinensis]
MDVNCGSYLKNYTKSAVEQKKLSISDIDRALHNLFSVRMRLGLFNGNPRNLLFGNIGANQVCTKEHQDLALEATQSCIVLLKNSNKLLPLKMTNTPSLAIIGPNANVSHTLLRNYEGPPCKKISPLQALQGYVRDTMYHQGCNAVNCSTADIEKAVEVAKKADYVVLVMGLDQGQEREYQDRDDLLLPGMQQSLIESVARAAKRAVVLALLCGGPVDVSFAKGNPKIGGILWAGYPGESGGIALAEIIFGDHKPDMRMRPDPSSGYPGRTYRFYKGEKVSSLATILATQNTPTSKETCKKAKISAIVGVKNDREMDGKHPVLLFVRQEGARKGSTVKQLIGFNSVGLKAGERAEFGFELKTG